jgi:hypothetical protein
MSFNVHMFFQVTVLFLVLVAWLFSVVVAVMHSWWPLRLVALIITCVLAGVLAALIAP